MFEKNKNLLNNKNTKRKITLFFKSTMNVRLFVCVTVVFTQMIILLQPVLLDLKNFELQTLVVSAATIPKIINYQGRLMDSSGNNVANGSYNIRFTLYDSATGGSQLWSASTTDGGTTSPSSTIPITVTNGLFSVFLGDTSINQVALPDSIFENDAIYLAIRVGALDGDMSPRKRLSSVPFAINSEMLQGQYASTSVIGSGDMFALHQASTTAATSQRSALAVYSSGTSDVNDMLIRANSNIDVFTISRQGNVTTTGNLQVASSTFLNGSMTFGNLATADTITFNSRVATDFNPSANDAYSLGTSALKWKNIFTTGAEFTNSTTTNATTTNLVSSYVSTSQLWVGGVQITGSGAESDTLDTVADRGYITNQSLGFAGASSTGSLLPTANTAYDLGSPTTSWRNVYASGTLIVNGATTLKSTLGVTGAATLSSTLGVTGATTLTGDLLSNGNTTLGNATTDLITVTGVVNSNVVPSGSVNLGSTVAYWANVYATSVLATYTTTTDLNVNGVNYSWPGANAVGVLRNDGTGVLTFNDAISQFTNDSGYLTSLGNAFVQAGNSFSATGTLGTNDSYGLQFETAGTVKMTMTSTGNVGIGNIAPAGKFQVTDGYIVLDKDFGFVMDGYNVGARNPIWGVSTAYPDYGFSYFEGATDYIGFHMNGTPAASNFGISGSGSVSVGNILFRQALDVTGSGLFSANVYSSGTVMATTGLSSYGTLNVAGNTYATGTVLVDGATTLNGSMTFGNLATADTITFNSRVATDFNPSANDAYSLGTSALKWKNIFATGAEFTNSTTTNATTTNFASSYATTSQLWVGGIQVMGSGVEADTLQTVTNRGYITTNAIGIAGASSTGSLLPTANTAYDLGSPTTSWRNMYASGTLIVNGATTLKSTLGVIGAATLSSTLGVTGVTTLTGNLLSNGNTTLGNAATDLVTVTGVVNSSVVPSGSVNLGSTVAYWANMYATTSNALNSTSTYATSSYFAVTNYVNSDLSPNQNLTRSLGDASHRWLNLFAANVSSTNINATGYVSTTVVTTTQLWVNGTQITGASGATPNLHQVTTQGATTSNSIYTGNHYPTTTLAFDLGSSVYRWKDVWASSTYIGSSTWNLRQKNNGGFIIAQQAGAERFYIGTNGRVGIATTTPQGLFHLSGSENVAQMIVQASSAQTLANPLLQLRASNGSVIGAMSTNDASNIFTGVYSGSSITTGVYNSFYGSSAGEFVTSGENNTAMGYLALYGSYQDITGSANTAIGSQAMYGYGGSITGSNNSAFGYQALASVNTGGGNTAIGMYTLRSNTSGYENTVVGATSMESNEDGIKNTVIGFQSLYENVSGDANVAVGHETLYHNEGDENIAIGKGASTLGESFDRTVAIGTEALFTNTIDENVGVGHRALRANNTGARLAGIGYEVMVANETGTDNTGVGHWAMASNISGSYNTAMGASAMGGAGSSNSNNTGVGYHAMYMIQTGSGNTSLGSNSLLALTTGASNTAIGYSAGANITTGSNNITIGNNINAVSAVGSNQLNIGNAIYGNLSTGYVGIGATNPATFRLQIAGNAGPNTTLAYDLGSSAYRWKDLWVSSTYIGSSTWNLRQDGNGSLTFANANTNQELVKLESDGRLLLKKAKFNSLGQASSTSPGYDSGEFVLQGNGWDYTANAAYATNYTLYNHTLSATTSEMRVAFTTGTNAIAEYQLSISNNGDMGIGGDLTVGRRLFLGNQTTGEGSTSTYIFVDDTLAPASTYIATNADGWQANTSYDYAERYQSDMELEPGELVVVDPNGVNKVTRSTSSHDVVLGIVSTKPGFMTGGPEKDSYPIALAGRVPTKVSTSNGKINAGDYLAPSDIPGVAVKAVQGGAVIGVALETYDKPNEGLISIFVNVGYMGNKFDEGVGSATNQNSAEIKGFALIKAGAMEVEVKYSTVQAYPLVQIMPYGGVKGSYWVQDVSDIGFKVVLSEAQTFDLKLGYEVSMPNMEMVSISDGTLGELDSLTGEIVLPESIGDVVEAVPTTTMDIVDESEQ